MMEYFVYNDKSINSQFWVEYYLFSEYLLLISKNINFFVPLEKISAISQIYINNSNGLRLFLKDFTLDITSLKREIVQPYISFVHYSNTAKYIDITPVHTSIFNDKLEVQMDNIYWDN